MLLMLQSSMHAVKACMPVYDDIPVLNLCLHDHLGGAATMQPFVAHLLAAAGITTRTQGCCHMPALGVA